MRLIFLGTGTSQGIPVVGSDDLVCMSKDLKDNRLRTSVLLEIEGVTIVVDCGPDFRYQMLREQINHIDAILFTHEHSDHTAGLDDIRPFFFKIGPIPVFASGRVMDSLDKRFDYIFSDENKYPGAPSVQKHILSGDAFSFKKVEIQPINIMHGNLPVFGFRFGNLAYLTDVKTIPESELSKLMNLDVLVISALFKEEHFTHLSLDEALEYIEILKPKKAYLTHISHKMGFHEEVQKELPENVFLAYDGLKISI